MWVLRLTWKLSGCGVLRYDPWVQRLCVCPDSDFFEAIRQNKLTVVTDRIKWFTRTGVMLVDGSEISADLVH